MKKGFSLPLLLVVLSLTFGAFLLIISKNPETNLEVPYASFIKVKDTKTYSNKTHGFELEYPKDFKKEEYQDFAADFRGEVKEEGEATPQAVFVRFSSSSESFDNREFDRILNLDAGKSFFEVLDVRSLVTKMGDFKAGSFGAVEYIVERNFSAPEGPRKEFRHVYEIKKDDTILRFLVSAASEEELETQNRELGKIISSLKFN